MMPSVVSAVKFGASSPNRIAMRYLLVSRSPYDEFSTIRLQYCAPTDEFKGSHSKPSTVSQQMERRQRDGTDIPPNLGPYTEDDNRSATKHLRVHGSSFSRASPIGLTQPLRRSRTWPALTLHAQN